MIKKVFPILFLIIITLSFFYKFFLKGLIPIPSDITTGMYYPWINHNYGYPVRVPVKNPILTDTVSQFWIWRNWGVSNLLNKNISFWNPKSLAGYSMSPWFHLILFSPGNVFYAFFSTTTSMALIVILQLLISLVSTYLLIKSLTHSSLPAIFGAVSFSFSSFFIGWLTWGTISWTLAFLPLILYFIHALLYLKRNFWNSIGLYISLVFSLLGGHPQTFLYVIIVICIYLFSFLITNKTKINKTFLVLGIFFLSFLSTTFVTVPSLQNLKNSIRETENYISSNGSGFIPFGKILITAFAPNFFGNPASNNYWGGDFNYQEKLVWYGTAALFLSILYLTYIIKNKKFDHTNLFLFIIFLLGILLSTEYPIGFLIYKFKLPLISSSSAGRAMVLLAFAGSILSSLAINNLIHNPKSLWSSFRFTSIIFIFFSLFLLLIAFINKNELDYQNLLSSTPYIQYSLSNFKVGLRNLLIPIFSVFSVIILLFTSFKFKKVTFISIYILIVVAAFEGFYYGWKYTPFTDKKLFFPKTEIINFLQTQYNTSKDFFRIEREKSELMPPNMWEPYDFYSLSGYDPMVPLNYSNYLIKNKIISNPTRYIEFDNDQIKDVSKLGIKYLLVLKRDKIYKVDQNGKIPYWIDSKKWNQVFEEGAVVVLENKEYKPPYFLKDYSPKDSVKLLNKNENSYEFEVNNFADNSLVFFENYDQNWHVLVNGKETSIKPYEGTFKSVDLSAGKNVVLFFYKNNQFIEFSKFSLVSLSISIIIIYLTTKNHQKE